MTTNECHCRAGRACSQVSIPRPEIVQRLTRDKKFTCIMTDLDNVVSSAFTGFARFTNRSSSNFGRVATTITSGLTCFVSAFNFQMWDPTGSHGPRTKLPLQCCRLNGTSPCTFHLTSRTRFFRTISLHEWESLRHEVITVNEKSNISYHVHQQPGNTETLDEF